MAAKALLGLLPVGVVERAACDALLDVAENGLMEAKVLLGLGHDRSLQHIFQIVLNDRERR
ncbi:hypothetical protein ACVOMV_19055 [Mesorhizobium atlanticum]